VGDEYRLAEGLSKRCWDGFFPQQELRSVLKQNLSKDMATRNRGLSQYANWNGPRVSDMAMENTKAAP